jgi:hypothetical protein
MRWHEVLGVGVLVMVSAAACTVEVISGPSGSGGTAGSGGSAGSAGSGGAKSDAAHDGAIDAATDAPVTDTSADGASSDAGDAGFDGPPNPDSPSRDATPDADVAVSDASPDRSVDGGASDGTMSDIARDAADSTDGCFAEDGPDAGPNHTCAMLPYYGTLCRVDGGMDGPPGGASLCDSLETELKASAFNELYACLEKAPWAGDGGFDACTSRHENAVDDCSRSIFNRSMCAVADSTFEGGVYGCTQVAASCGPDSGDGGIPVELCRAWLGPFNASVRQAIVDCYLDPTPVGATSCRDKFENHCVFRE